MLTAAGVGSGLDIESVISQLMAFERRPLNRLEAQKQDVQLNISANGQLRSAIARFQNAINALSDSDSLGGSIASSSDESVLTLSASADADSQSHAIAVTRLATADRLSSNAYTDLDTAIGTGTLDITVAGDTLNLTLDASNNTLAQIRDAINSSGLNPGVTASVITVDGGAQLILTADETGTANAISVVAGAGLTGFSTTQLGTLQDALITVDGFNVTSGSNTISSAITGVTLNLQAPGSANVSFSGDSSLLASAAQELADSYNFLRGNMKALSANALAGDSLLLGLERSINARLSSTITLPDSSTGFLFEAGVTFDDQGDLAFDATVLAGAVNADPTRVLTMFSADSSLTGDLNTFLDGYLQDDGIIDTRIDTLESRDVSLDRQVERTTFRLAQTEERMRAQFTALDVLLARLSVTGDFLTQQLASLPSNSNNNRR
ncbi:MAG: flagellar hook-associated protein 2 [Gammaproteobacteria bacterium]|jgi:flagellar hook-associated protein 2